MSEFNIRQRYLLTFVIILTTILIIGGFIIYPSFFKILSIKNEILSQEKELEKKLSQGLNAKKIKLELDETESQLSKLNEIFINKNEALNLLSIFEDLGAENKLTTSVKPDFNLQSSGNGIYRIQLEINTLGTIPDTLAFLNDLDKSNFYFVIDKLKFSKGAGADIISNISGQVYLKD